VSLIARLDDKQFNGYLLIRLPSELDDVVARVVAAYQSSSPAEQATLIGAVSGRVAGVLSCYGQRMASIAVRSRSEDALRSGLMAVGMGIAKLDDWRDSLYPLAALNHAATTIGSDLSQLVNQVASDLPDAAVSSVRAFVARSDRGKSLEAMGMRVLGVGDAIRYR
jgi:hypothetical protein